MGDFTDKGISLTSQRSDALSFGSQRRNLVHTVDMMLRNSWNEVVVGKYDSVEGLMASLCEIFDHKTIGAQQELPRLICASYNSPRAMSVSKRVQRLFKDIGLNFKLYSKDLSPRLVIRVARSFCIMQVQERKMTAEVVTESEFLKLLAKPQQTFSPIFFDSLIDKKRLLPTICAHHHVGRIQVFYTRLADNTALIYILDEKGSMFYKQQPFMSERALLYAYKELVDNILHRRRLAAYEQDDMDFDLDVEYYRADKSRGRWSLTEVSVPEQRAVQGLDVRVSYDSLLKRLHIYCNDDAFSSLEHGDALYSVVAGFIRTKRSASDDYPVYVTDIDVPFDELGAAMQADLQTIHYLRYKRGIEEKLNV